MDRVRHAPEQQALLRPVEFHILLSLAAGDFGRGLFQLIQSSRPSARGLTELVLKGGSFSRSRCRVRRSLQGA